MNRAFDHILIIMMENQYRGYVLENTYMKNLAAQGIELTNSFGVMHPSQTNYISSIAGELCNVTDDDRPIPALTQNTIVDLIEASPENLDWRAYMDSYVADATPWKSENFKPADAYPYVIKHNPFSSFENILNNQQRWAKVENEAGLFSDLLNNRLPNYAWFTPNMWNDGHYLKGTTNDSLKGERAPVLVNQQAEWLESFFTKLKFPGTNSLLPKNTLVVVTYDEADFEAFYDKGDKYFYDGPNQIYTVLLGDMIKPAKEAEAFNHYSLLKTVEKNFNLGSLGKNDEHANWHRFLWGERFQWQAPNHLPSQHITPLAACEYQDLLYTFTINEQQHICYRTWANTENVSAEQIVDLSTHISAHSIAVTANTDSLLLVMSDYEHQLHSFSYTLNNGWQAAPVPTLSSAVQLSLTTLPTNDEFMLVTQDISGTVNSSRYTNNEWQAAQPITAAQIALPTDSEKNDQPLTLTAIGACVFLIYRHQDTQQLCAITYNTESYNQTSIEMGSYSGPYDNAGINTWSPSAFPLTHYSQGACAITPGEDEPVEQTYTGAGCLTAATLDGVLHLLHNGTNNSSQLLTERFSISGLLTPNLPVSYVPPEDPNKPTTNNGYGTLAQAGWSLPEAINGVIRESDSVLASCVFKEQVWVFYKAGKHVMLCIGEYGVGGPCTKK